MTQFYIESYHLVTKNRHASAHGGLAFYMHKTFKTRTYAIESLHWEEMFVELTNPLIGLKQNLLLAVFTDHRMQQ